MRCNAEFYYVGKIPPIAIGRPSSAPTRGFTMALFTASRRNNFVEVHAIHQVPSSYTCIYNAHKFSSDIESEVLAVTRWAAW